MTNEQSIVLDYLKSNAVGKGNRKTSGTIRGAVNLSSGGATNENIRQIIRELIDLGEPIGSNSQGYYIIDDPKELQEVKKSLIQRGLKTIQRALKLDKNYP